jgi:RND superfamily putative drug exporter
MQKITATVLRHRALVALVWIVLTVIGGLMVGKANSGLSHQQATPGLAGYDANQAIIRRLGLDGGEAPVIAVLRLPPGQSMHTAAGQATAARTFAAPAQRGHVGLIDYGTSHNAKLISRDGRSTWALYDMPNPDTGPYTNTVNVIKPALAHATPAGATVTVTGSEALQSTGSGGGSGLSTLDETLIGAAAALIVLGFVYGSAIAVVPLLMALPTILTTFLLVYGLEQLTSISSLLQYLVAFIGLGIAIDYSLLIVTRWREERESGKEPEEAILAAADHAGRAVVLSGLTVAVGLLSLLIIPVQFLQGIGLGSLLIPLCAIATSITLLPVVLSAWGPALDRHRVRRGSTTYSRAWERWANVVVNRRWIASIVGLAIMIGLAIPALSMNTGQPSVGSLGGSSPAARAFHSIERQGVPNAVSWPIQILVHGGTANAQRATSVAQGTSGVWTVLTPRLSPGSGKNTALLTAIPTGNGSTSAGQDTVNRLRTALAREPGAIRVGGDTAANMDFTNAIYGKFPLMLAVISLITFVLLARSFRSVALALKAVVLNLISLGAAFGFLVLFWQQGHGSNAVYGISATQSIRNWVPVIMFAFLFGISMDYEVFVLARLREEYDKTGDTRQAIVQAIARTGRLITCAALILGISFASLSTVNDLAVEVPATGLAVGVILDAVIVRTLLVPALAALLGRWNWWMPAPLARVLRVPAVRPVSAEGSGA